MGDGNSKLKEIALEILGNVYFEEFYRFFKSILIEQKKAKDKTTYISLITRRCSCLTYIFLQILREEKENIPFTNKKYDDEVTFLTESALINKGWYIGQQLLLGNDGASPDIWIVDDSIAYGRALSNALEQFENEVRRSIESNQDKAKRAIAYEKFDKFKRNNISIHVLAEKQQANLLSNIYADVFHSQISLDSAQWNGLSNRISELIINVNVANAAFVVSKGTDQSLDSPGRQWIKIDKEYRDHKQSVFFRPLINSMGNYKAVCAIRCIQCSTINKYRLIPFVFLPPLSEMQIEEIERYIFRKFKGIIQEEELQDADFDQITLKSRLDFITMYISLSALSVFEKESQLDVGGADCYDWEKVLWHYSDTKLRYRIFKELFSMDHQDVLLSWVEIQEIVSRIRSDRYIDIDQELPRERLKDLKFQCDLDIKIEDYLYEYSVNVEREANQCLLEAVRLGDYTIARLSSIRYSDFFQFLEELRDKIDYKKDDKCHPLELLAGVFQMMDAGLMSIVSAPLKEGSERMVSHQIRICELAISVLPRRYYRHADKLMSLERKKWLTEEKIEQELTDYYNSLVKKGIIEDSGADKFVQELKYYMDSMNSAAQKISYWTVGINRHYGIKRPKNGIRQLVKDSDMRKIREEYSSAI